MGGDALGMFQSPDVLHPRWEAVPPRVQQPAPVVIGPGQAAHLQPEDKADVIEAKFGHQALEAKAPLGSAPGVALVLVDDEDAVGRPAEVHGPSSESVLSPGGLGV